MRTRSRINPHRILCPFCTKTFTRTEHLQRHLGSHGLGKAVTCPQCGKDFMRKDVMKRHLAKCPSKLQKKTEGNILTDVDDIVQAEIPENIQRQDNYTETINPRARQQNQKTGVNQPLALDKAHNRPELVATDAIDVCTPDHFSENSLSESWWSGMQFEFSFDPVAVDQEKYNHPSSLLPSNVLSAPLINIDPVDTFNFLVRFANRELISLESCYDCGALYERQWAAQAVRNDSTKGQNTVAVTEPRHPITEPQNAGIILQDVPNDLAGAGRVDIHHTWNCHGTQPPSQVPFSGVGPAYEIVHQIKTLSQYSTIMHTWSPQLEGECIRFFSADNIERFIRIYWTAWHPHYPVIHKPTFSVASAPAYLTASMAILGACLSPNANDRQNVRLWLNSVEEMIFTNKYFCDTMLLDPAVVNVRNIIQLLQAAYCVCTFQLSEGSEVSKRRIRRQRYSLMVTLARDFDLLNITHSNLDFLSERDFCWDSFIAVEESIRTIHFILMHDVAFGIFCNYPLRMRIQEMSLGMACPEACFQAQSAADCFLSIKAWTSHPLWACRMTLREIMQVIVCKDIDIEIRNYLSHLGIMNLWIVCSALCSEALQINSLLTVDAQLEPMWRAIQNWKAAWNQRYILQDNFGLPKEEDRVLTRPEQSWQRVGFFQNAAEYWLLLQIIVQRVDQYQRNRPHDYASKSGTDITRPVNMQPYMRSKHNSPTIADPKHLIIEHHQRFRLCT